ncbi:MAG: hypothetical protein K2X87_08530 [Gemmataceae bacterium]|nr:hypothetical protein [Gemmataceae bacterium]
MADHTQGLSDEAGGKIANWVWNRRDEIANALVSLYSWFRGIKRPDGPSPSDPADDQPGILIIGPGGVGKSTLGHFLSGQFDLLVHPPGEYDESLDTEGFVLEPEGDDGTGVRLVIPPGQEHKRAATWNDLYADIAGGKFRGVIVLNAYGYHSLGKISYKQHKLHTRGKNVFLEAFLGDRRVEELRVLRQLAPHLAANRQKMWLLTLVTKQDLWWDQRGVVEAHYRDGEWAAEVGKIAAQHGAVQFRHEFCFASLVIANFSTGAGELLRTNTAGYDHGGYVVHLRKLIEVFDSLRRWEGSRGQG